MMATDRPTVAVVGAGFSGLLTAVHLMAVKGGPRVRLIERRTAFARGAAYSTTSAEHLLNVRAANMSAFPDRPDHFTEWLSGEGGAELADGPFVTRARYGAYLQAMLRQVAEQAQAGRLILESDAVVELAPRDGGWALTLGMGRTLEADAVVLAIGNLPPHLPPGVDAETARSPGFFGDPWAADFGALPEEGCAVLIGAGLTMVDVALRLARERPQLRILAISRRGLLPRRHLVQGPAAEALDPLAAPPSALLKAVRRRARTADWRCVVDGLRPHVQGLWRGWRLEERRRFLRHVRPWWEIHRHRIAPAVASRLDHLTASGALTVTAGRLAQVRPAGGALSVGWTPRGSRELRETSAVAVVNCTGPNGDLFRVDDSMLAGLNDRGLIRADACRLGLDVDAQGRLLDRQGRAHAALFAVGPPTRGAFWEITSVPDIRLQAAACAREVVTALNRVCAS